MSTIARNCRICHLPIPLGRLEALPSATTCVIYSKAKPVTTDQIDIDGPSIDDLYKAVSQPYSEV